MDENIPTRTVEELRAQGHDVLDIRGSKLRIAAEPPPEYRPVVSARQKHSNPWFRSLAALALLMFVTAQSACFLHCHMGGDPSGEDPSGDESLPPCHRSAGASGCHDQGKPGDDSSWPMSGATCFTLKSMLAGPDAPTVTAPDFSTAHPIAGVDVAIEACLTREVAIGFRHDRPADWIFTPAVSLGPAFRSLAPPHFA